MNLNKDSNFTIISKQTYIKKKILLKGLLKT